MSKPTIEQVAYEVLIHELLTPYSDKGVARLYLSEKEARRFANAIAKSWENVENYEQK